MRKRKPCRRQTGYLPRNIVCKSVGKLSSAFATCIGEDGAGLGAKPANAAHWLLMKDLCFGTRDKLTLLTLCRVCVARFLSCQNRLNVVG